MSTSRDLKIKERYPNMSEDNAVIVQEYYNQKAQDIKSDATFIMYDTTIKIVCNMLNDNDVLPLREWDVDIAKQYIRSGSYNYSTLSRLLKVIREILEYSGCRSNVSQLKAGLKSRDFPVEYNAPFCTLSELETIMYDEFRKSHPNFDWEEMNDWSTAIVICYLLWIGYTKNEISMLHKSDYNSETGSFILKTPLGNKVRNIGVHTDMYDYINRYSVSTEYKCYNEYHKDRIIRYADSDSFIRTLTAANGTTHQTVKNHGDKIRNYFHVKPEEITMAGRLDRLYIWDLTERLPINIKNAKEIGKRLDIYVPERVLKSSEISTVISTYPSYKFKRENSQRNL